MITRTRRNEVTVVNREEDPRESFSSERETERESGTESAKVTQDHFESISNGIEVTITVPW